MNNNYTTLQAFLTIFSYRMHTLAWFLGPSPSFQLIAVVKMIH